MNINRIKKNIKKVEEIVESIDVQDVINRMEKDKENSIEEDIILLKDFTEGNFKRDKLENYKGSYKMGCFYYKDIQQAIEQIILDYKRVLKENEILKKEKEQAWEEWNNLEQGSYETEQKLKQQLKKLQKENEELKFEERSRIIGKYGDAEIHDVINRTLSNDYIPIQKLKDKIEEILNNGEYTITFEGDADFADEATRIDAQKYIKLEKLQELLEGRK